MDVKNSSLWKLCLAFVVCFLAVNCLLDLCGFDRQILSIHVQLRVGESLELGSEPRGDNDTSHFGNIDH